MGYGLEIGRGNPRDVERSGKGGILIIWALDLSKERTLARGFMTGTGSTRGKEGVSTPSIKQELHICPPDPLKEKDLGKKV